MIKAKNYKSKIILNYFIEGREKPDATLVMSAKGLKITASEYISIHGIIYHRARLPIISDQSFYAVNKAFADYCEAFDFFGRTDIDKRRVLETLTEGLEEQKAEYDKEVKSFYCQG